MRSMRLNQNITLILIFVILIVVLIYNHFFSSSFAKPAVIITVLNDLQKETLSNINEMTKLLISLSTALFGLIGYFTLNSFKSIDTINKKIRIDLVLAFSLAALSIDFGYIIMEKWVEMLTMGVFKPFDTLVRLPQSLQIITFLLSLFFAGRLVYKTLFNSKKETRK